MATRPGQILVLSLDCISEESEDTMRGILSDFNPIAIFASQALLLSVVEIDLLEIKETLPDDVKALVGAAEDLQAEWLLLSPFAVAHEEFPEVR